MCFKVRLSKIRFFFLISLLVMTSFDSAYAQNPVVSPWSGSFLSEIGRGANINHSKVLDAEYPDKRIDASLLFSGTLKYKSSAKNSFSATHTISRVIVTNPGKDSDEDWLAANLRVGWTRSTNATILGSRPIELPFSVSLPTSYASREKGFVGGLRFNPAVSWELNPTFSLSYTWYIDTNFQNPPEEVYKSDVLIEKASVILANSLTLSANLTDTVSISQSVGTASKSVNLRNPLGMDQVGAYFAVSSGASWAALPSLCFDFIIGQTAPIQGSGYLATKVYDDNQFKLYHEAQTSYTLDVTYLF